MNKEISKQKSELMVYSDFLKKMQRIKENNTSSPKQSGNKTKKIGTNPQSGGIVFLEDNIKGQRGFIGVVMLSFITAFLETLFLLIGFYFFK